MSEGIKRYNAPLQIILMFGIIIATILAGYLMYPDSDAEQQALLAQIGTSNRGTLLSPTLDTATLGLRQQDGSRWQIPTGRKWRLFIPVAGTCSDACRQMLYITRQVHVRLNKQMHRVERGYLSLDGGLSAELQEFLAQEHPHILVLNSERDAFDAWQAGSQLEPVSEQQVALLVDPLGQAMMFYDATNPGSDILLDLEHLLKYSPE